MLADRRIDEIEPAENVRILRLFWFGLLLRLALALAFQISGVDQTLNLTKDANLYDSVGKKIAEHYRSGGETKWPGRVSGFLDHFYEHLVGATCYVTDDSMLAIRLINVLCGSLVILVTWRMARDVADADIAYRCGLWACFFPTLFYYSCLPVRDAQSTLAMALVFLGMTTVTSSGKILHMMALPTGLLLMAGYRTYVAAALVILIPASWLLTLLITRSRTNYQLACRNILVALLVVAVVGPVVIAKVYSTRKASKIADINSWNKVRQQLNDGNGALYEDGAVPKIGESSIETVRGAAIGLYFFFLSVNPTAMNSVRQWMAVPEALIVLCMMPMLFRGFYQRGREVSLLHLQYFGEELIVPSGALPLSFQAVCGGMVL